MTHQEDPAEAPLDPATERVRRKMVRLLAVSIGVMLVGVMAVLGAVVYRAGEAGEGRLATGASVPFVLPAGSEVLETGLDADSVLLRITVPGAGQELLVLDRRTGTMLSRHPLTRP